jgi:hypothetical protein
MSEKDDAAAARYEDEENLRPAGPPRRVRAKPARALSSHVPIRFSAESINAIKLIATADGMTVSSWVRTIVQREVTRRQVRPVTQARTAASFFGDPSRVAETFGHDAEVEGLRIACL